MGWIDTATRYRSTPTLTQATTADPSADSRARYRSSEHGPCRAGPRLLLGIDHAGGHTGVVHIGGWVGLATAAAAWYASLAAVTNSTFGRVVLPVVPLGRRTDA